MNAYTTGFGRKNQRLQNDFFDGRLQTDQQISPFDIQIVPELKNKGKMSEKIQKQKKES